jgi:hypothetical protein
LIKKTFRFQNKSIRSSKLTVFFLGLISYGIYLSTDLDSSMPHINTFSSLNAEPASDAWVMPEATSENLISSLPLHSL